MTRMLAYFECDAPDLGIILSSIGSNMELVKNLRVEAQIEPTKKKTKRHVSSRPNRVRTSLVNALQGNNPVSYDKLSDALEAAGLNRNSLSPALSSLHREGIVERNTKDKTVWLKKPTS